MATISPVHGGGPLVNRIVSELPDAETLPKVLVNDVDLTSLYRIADGTLSPLTGPMTIEDYNTVLASKHIIRNGQPWAWTIPICLPVTSEEARSAPEGSKVALFSESAGKVFGILNVSSLYEWDKAAFIKAVYGTDRVDHPGARLWMNDERSTMLGGEISLLPYDDPRPFKDAIFNPTTMRAFLAEKGYGASIAFQTRNPLHRAHEYALVYGAETLLRSVGDEKKVGVFLNPLVGQLKGDDVPAATRMETYDRLLSGGFLGEGDADLELWNAKKQNLKDQVKLAGLDMRMFYGGPSEAVMHAIYRQNLGITHFIIGRKHADAPFDDKTAIWGDFDAQEVFSNLGGALSIKTVNVGFAAYFQELGRVALVADNKDKQSVSISGTKVREMLNRGEKPDERVMRPSTAEVLIKYYTEKNAAKAE